MTFMNLKKNSIFHSTLLHSFFKTFQQNGNVVEIGLHRFAQKCVSDRREELYFCLLKNFKPKQNRNLSLLRSRFDKDHHFSRRKSCRCFDFLKLI